MQQCCLSKELQYIMLYNVRALQSSCIIYVLISFLLLFYKNDEIVTLLAGYSSSSVWEIRYFSFSNRAQRHLLRASGMTKVVWCLYFFFTRVRNYISVNRNDCREQLYIILLYSYARPVVSTVSSTNTAIIILLKISNTDGNVCTADDSRSKVIDCCAYRKHLMSSRIHFIAVIDTARRRRAFVS